MKKELICIVCPMGCRIELTLDDNNKIVMMEGNTCKRGAAYAEAELTNPVRTLTSTVALKDGVHRRLPVITSKAIPKDRLFDVMSEINKIEICSPVNINDIIIKNVCGLETDIIASRSVKKVEYIDNTKNNTGNI